MSNSQLSNPIPRRGVEDIPFSNGTVGGYLIWRLYQLGVDAMFGVPGDFALGLFELVEKSPISYVGMCNELNAGYAADGYARVKGVGAVMVTYAVGELSALNAIAGAFAERVPVVIIVGTPPTSAFETQPLLHHSLGSYTIPMDCFEKITCAQAFLKDPLCAPDQIDRVLADLIYHQKPVYISLPSDIVFRSCRRPEGPFAFRPHCLTDVQTLHEAAQEAAALLNAARAPVIIVDMMVARFKLQREALWLIESCGYPFVTMMMGKAIFDEHHPQFIGLYEGNRSRELVRKRVENADAILMLGVIMTDLNTGGFTAEIDPGKLVNVGVETTSIKYHRFDNIRMGDFIQAMVSKLHPKRFQNTESDVKPASLSCVHRPLQWHQAFERARPLTVARFFDFVAHILPENSVVIADTGQSLFSVAETLLPQGSKFIAQVFFGSIGYSIGATVGVATALLNTPPHHVFLFVGDGSLQVTCQDISTMIRLGMNVTVFVLNNDGYGIERCILDGDFNTIARWNYHLLPLAFGAPMAGCNPYNENDLEQIASDPKFLSSFNLIEVHVDRNDYSDTLIKAGQSMAEYNQLTTPHS